MPDRLEREIEEIIRGKGDLPPASRRARRAPKPRRPAGANQRLSAGPGTALLASVGLLVISILLWNTAQGLGMALVVGAAVFFVLFLALAFEGRTNVGGYEKRWRGQPVTPNPVPLKDRIKRLWRRLRR